MRKLAKEAWFSAHRESLDLSIGDMMKQLTRVVREAKALIADEAARYIVDLTQ